MYRVILAALALVSTAWASPQWLQYRTSERALDVVGGSSVLHQPEMEKPNIALPPLSCDKPIFIKWQTPMGPAGFRWAVFDKKNKFGVYSICYFDKNGNGRLDDDPRLEGIQTNEYEIEFGKVGVLFDSADGPISYQLNLRFYSYDEDSTYVYAYAGCWYEGNIEIGGQKHRCLLLDYNVNGTFNDTSKDFYCDRIQIDSQQAYVGNYLEYQDKLYRQTIAQDGAFVEIAPASDVAYGTVTLPKEITEFSAGGLNGMFNRQVQGGQIRLPEGEYRIYDWKISRKDSKGVQWRLEGASSKERFNVVKDVTAELPRLGEPVFSNVSVSDQGKGSFYFNQTLTGQLGESISLYKDNSQAPAPKIHIRSKTGEYDRTFSLEYG